MAEFTAPLDLFSLLGWHMTDEGIRHLNEEGERLAHDLARLAVRIPTNKMLSRLRFAVTPLEYQQLEAYALARDGAAVGMVKGIRLVVEDDPDDETMGVAFT